MASKAFYMHRLLFILLLLFVSLSAPAQQSAHFLYWEEGKQLNWQHFKGRPDTDDHVHAAVTFAGIDLQVEHINLLGEITFKARAVFDQQLSWAYEDRQSPAILQHEQLHFDIAEVYARKLERKLNSLKIRKSQKAGASKLLQRYTRAQLASQARYDAETVHGLNHKKQKAWQELVDRELLNPSSRLEMQLPAQSLTAGIDLQD